MSQDTQKIKVVGITGGIGCGMSSVAKMMESWGGIVISGDDVARDIVRQGMPAYKEVVATFGEDILQTDKEINRKKLGNIVFSEKEQLMALNKAVHPYWIERMQQLIEQAKKTAGDKFVIVDAAILIETGLNKMVDYVVVVNAPMRQRREWIMKRNDIDECQADQRVFSQVPVTEKMKLANTVIENNGTMEQLNQEVTAIKSDILGVTAVNAEKGA
jgi:dephospho-CoA kinase